VIPNSISTCACLALLLPLLSYAGEWVPIDEVVSDPAIPLVDPEFDEVDKRAAWQVGPTPNFDGKLLVGDVDPDNGDILDPLTGIPLSQGGSGLIIDSDLVEIAKTGNGPEWALGVAGGQIVYTKYDAQQRQSVARSTFDGSVWLSEILVNGQNRFTPKGSRFAPDPRPKAAYFGYVNGPMGIELRLAARILGLPFTERVSTQQLRGGNFLPGESAFITTSRSAPGEPYQAYMWDYDVDVLQPITFDSGSKRQSPEVWFAPDFGDDLVCVTNVTLGTFGVGRVYRRVDPLDNFNWVLEVEIESPNPAKPFVGSPRPFVFEGKSYIVFMAEGDPFTTDEADIWIADLDPDPITRFYRKVSNDEPGIRLDPETFVTTNGPIIYYSKASGSILNLRRAQTGIVPGGGP